MRLKLWRLFCYSTLLLILGLVVYTVKTLHIYSAPRVHPAGTKDVAETRMAERLQRISKVCLSNNVRPGVNSGQYALRHPPAPQYSIFYFHRRQSLAYCPIYKAASTSMLHWLLQMQGVGAEDIRKSSKQVSDIARQYYPSVDYPEADQLLTGSVRFMVVRHPFERLLSAYRDKLSNSTINREHGSLHFYEKYGRKIVAKYRHVDPHRPAEQIEPTFAEFVSYLIDTNLMLYADDHWIPYYLFCTPCLVDYDVIVHFETLDSDMDLLLDVIKTRTSGARLDKPGRKHSSSGKVEESVRAHFGALSKDTVRQLYEKYRLDFELFGYRVDEYLALAHD